MTQRESGPIFGPLLFCNGFSTLICCFDTLAVSTFAQKISEV